MPKVNLSVPHSLGQAEAQGRVQKLITDTRAQFGGQLSDVHETWNANVCDLSWKSMGMGMSATVTVNEGDVAVDGSMPMAFMAFKGKMEGLVRGRLSDALAAPTS
jgi:hypothetical protein